MRKETDALYVYSATAITDLATILNRQESPITVAPHTSDQEYNLELLSHPMVDIYMEATPTNFSSRDLVLADAVKLFDFVPRTSIQIFVDRTDKGVLKSLNAVAGYFVQSRVPFFAVAIDLKEYTERMLVGYTPSKGLLKGK